LHNWSPVIVDEFALIIAMGIVRKPDVVDYWSEDQALKTLFFGNCMSREVLGKSEQFPCG
jgi:hypothetical protein